jgi:hypothetical protein
LPFQNLSRIIVPRDAINRLSLGGKMLWDVFISHASEDMEEVARPLATLIRGKGFRVWLDEQQLRLGDSLSRKINDGLAFSRFGVVVLSDSFLKKDYPQKELQALLARQSSDDRYILPVLHHIDQSALTRKLPLLSDLLAVSTERGIEHVAAEVAKAISDIPDYGQETNGPRYFTEFEFPVSLVTKAVKAIRLLILPSTWEHLVPKRDMSNPAIWMGSDSEVLVSLLFDLYAPLAHLWTHRYAIKRTVTSLNKLDRIRFALLEGALDALSRDSAIASSAPRLIYTPRVADWRSKRAETPTQFWWQGLTAERFARCVPLFYDPNDAKAVPSYSAFSDAYRAAYESTGEGQQTIGLLANALYGFTPGTRPIYWRLLLLWGSIDSLLLDLAENSADEVFEKLLEGTWLNLGEFQNLPTDVLPEEPGSTEGALRAYFANYMRPPLREYLDY